MVALTTMRLMSVHSGSPSSSIQPSSVLPARTGGGRGGRVFHVCWWPSRWHADCCRFLFLSDRSLSVLMGGFCCGGRCGGGHGARWRHGVWNERGGGRGLRRLPVPLKRSKSNFLAGWAAHWSVHWERYRAGNRGGGGGGGSVKKQPYKIW